MVDIRDWLHLLYHVLLLLGCICHFLLDFLLHLLFDAQAFDDLVDNGGSVGLVMESEGICGDGQLTLFDVSLRFLEMGFERWPSFFSFWFAVPLPDVA